MRLRPNHPLLMTTVLAALAAAAACDPPPPDFVKKGYQGKPPLGDAIDLAAEPTITVGGNPSNWRWVPFPDSTCGDGSATGIAIDWLDPLDAGTDDLVVFFDGGGACWSYSTCTAGGAVDKSYGVGKFQTEAADFIPCSLTNRANLPPALTGATIVFVPYCTGDVHGGDSFADYGTWPLEEPWEHRGHANVMAYLKRLGATFTRVDKLVVTGSSAGGFGALVNYEAFRWYWPGAQGYLIDDSGPALVNNDVPADFRQKWFANWGLNVATDPFCADCRDNFSAAYRDLAALHPDDRIALLTHESDPVMTGFMLFLPGAPYTFEDALRRVASDVLRPTATARAFFESGSDHMLLTPVDACTADPTYVDDHIAGTSIALDDWLEQMVSDDAAWSTRID